MQISRVCKVYFSPCGAAEKVVSVLAECASKLLGVPVEGYDFTLPKARKRSYEFMENDLVFFATPVYAGRVPNRIMPYIKKGFHGNGAVAVPVVVFGNRAYDDALVELQNLLRDNFFCTTAAGAVVARHSFSQVIADGRPDESDQKELEAFARKVWEKVNKASSGEGLSDVSIPGTNPPESYYVPLGVDGKPAKFLKAAPKTREEICTRCGICAEYCPMGSIDHEHPEIIGGICIKCQACIRKCPAGAKYFDDASFLSHKKMLEENYMRRAENAFFV